MKILIWIIVAIVIVGGLFWFMSGDSNNSSNDSENQQNSGNTDTLSENGRVIDTDDKVFEEIDEALTGLG
ncbi:hypothetical protein J4423_01355 [Candidatus Pacearchaeota archaeon]|nr:hypothetical protein [Candidatus Pacearchaeota archaeon]